MALEIAALCWVLAVHDGDTLRVQCAPGQNQPVRLAYVDAPESGQAWGRVSGKSLRKLCLHTNAWIQPITSDRYGRTVATVHCRAKDASHHQVERGMAWMYLRYPPADAILKANLLQDQERAMGARRGLWRDQSPTPPWEWRAARR